MSSWVRQRWYNLFTGDFVRKLNVEVKDSAGRLLMATNAAFFEDIGVRIKSGAIAIADEPELCGGAAFDPSSGGGATGTMSISTPRVGSNLTRINIVHEAVHAICDIHGFHPPGAVEEAAAYVINEAYRQISHREPENYSAPAGISCTDLSPRLMAAARAGTCDLMVPLRPIAASIARGNRVGRTRRTVVLSTASLDPLVRLIVRDCSYNDGGTWNPMHPYR